jgi:hypothetical protein
MNQLNSSTDFNPSLKPHLHLDSDRCPSCGQDIPPEKFQEISGKIAAREREHAQAITTKLSQQYETERSQAAAKAAAELDAERVRSASREALAREEARKAAELIATERLAAADRAREDLQAAMQKQVEEAEAKRSAAERAGVGLQAQLVKVRDESAAAIEDVKKAASARETEIRAEASRAADLAAAEKIKAVEAAKLESEGALQALLANAETSKTAAEERGAALASQLVQAQKAKEAEVAKVKEDAALEHTRIRKEATETAEAGLRDQLTTHANAAAEAAAKLLESENKLSTITEQHTADLVSQREILDKAKDDALNAANAKAFEETQKLSLKVNELQRALEKKTNDELGEGAEINLFESLKLEFPDDRITRIAKGSAGADVRHVVISRGKECGTILYDSKNHKAFRWDHVTKLRTDQLADKAEHAILSTHKFPEGTRQLHTHEGVVLANPARVVAIASMIRVHLIHVHTLQLSSIERESKTAALYSFITSEQCAQLMTRIDERASELLEEQVKEKKWHEKHWQKQGEAYRAIQKAKANLENEISSIISAELSEGSEDDEGVQS